MLVGLVIMVVSSVSKCKNVSDDMVIVSFNPATKNGLDRSCVCSIICGSECLSKTLVVF